MSGPDVGFLAPRKWGWDCHGLPVEYEMQQTLNITTRAEVSSTTRLRVSYEMTGTYVAFDATRSSTWAYLRLIRNADQVSTNANSQPILGLFGWEIVGFHP